MVRQGVVRSLVWLERQDLLLLRATPRAVQRLAIVLQGQLRIAGAAALSGRSGEPDGTSNPSPSDVPTAQPAQLLERFDCVQLDGQTSCELVGSALLLRLEITAI